VSRVTELDLPGILPADKVPKFYATVLAEKDAREKKVTLPDVERELKALGWTVVKGQFIRKAPGIYESTQGRLEVARTNGRMEFILHKGGGDGTVNATVRSEFGEQKDNNGGGGGRNRNRGFPGFAPRDTSVEGYGMIASMHEVKSYGIEENTGQGRGGPGGFGGGNRDPHLLGTNKLADVPKHHFLITASENTLEFFVDGQRETKVSSGKVSQKGPFVLDVNGTVTIEAPRTGQ